MIQPQLIIYRTLSYPKSEFFFYSKFNVSKIIYLLNSFKLILALPFIMCLKEREEGLYKMKDTFMRHEIKYLLNEKQRFLIERAMDGRMCPDSHGESTIRSIYFDTDDFLLIRRSSEKPIYKEKLRLRSYGIASGNDKVFLELKKKYKGIVYKRRLELTEAEVEDYFSDKAPLPCGSSAQICREIDYFINFYGSLKPRVFLSYDRSAYYSEDNAGFRMTFDKNIRYRTTSLSLAAAPGGERLLDRGTSLLEIKTGTGIPLWLVTVLDEEKIRKQSFSKYGSAYLKMRKEGTA